MADSITCHICKRTSYHPEDVRYRYCGHCNAFHIGTGTPQERWAHMREIIIKAAGLWEASNAGKAPPENLRMRALAARYRFSYDWLMGRKNTPEL
jgi:hypothetical protein